MVDRSFDQISSFLTGNKLDSLPMSVVHESKRAFLDTVGCMIAGVDTPIGRALVKLCSRYFVAGGALVIGADRPSAHFYAAMCNSFMANAHDADDGHRASRLHAGGIIIPTLLAMSEEKDCKGSKFLEAVVIAYEIGLRAGIISTYMDTYYGSAFGTTFGASAAAGRILDLPPQKIINALGICEIQAPNCMVMGWVRSRKIPMIKEGMGWAAGTAVMAAHMAEQGITGTLTLFSSLEAREILESLGRDFEILKRYYKPHPGCRWVHGPRIAMMSLIQKNELIADDIDSIEVATFEKAAQLDNLTPANIEEAEYSFPYIMGASLIEGDFSIHQMIEDKINDKRILEQGRKVKLKIDPEADESYPTKLKAKITIRTKDGGLYEALSESSKGDWDNPLSDEELETKFRQMVSQRLEKDQAELFVRRIWNLENETSMARFIAELGKMVLKL